MQQSNYTIKYVCKYGKGKYANMQVCNNACMQVSLYESMQACKYAITKVCKYVSV